MIAYQHTPWGRMPLGAKDGRQTAIEVHVPDVVAALLAIVTTHDGVEPEKFAAEAVARAVNERAEAIGIARLAQPAVYDLCAGRAAVARRSHKPEVASSNLAPATIHTHTRESEKGRGDVPLGVLPMPPSPEKPPP